MKMRDVYKDPQIRHTPYTIQHSRRGVQGYNEDEIHIPARRNGRPQEREKRENTEDDTTGSWFKVTVPYGRKYDKAWLVNSIQSRCRVSFTPVDFHYVKHRALFFVQDASTAYALKDVSYKICDEENQKICIFVNPSTVPYSMQNKLKPEQMEQLKLTMNKRYNVSKQTLDLQRLRFDPDLVGHNMDIILNRRDYMAATLQIIERSFSELLSLNLCNNKLYQLDGLSDITEKAPKVKILNLSQNELKSTWELGKVKGLKLEELWLEGNPLCSTFPHKSAYVSAVKDYFPKLLYLDGQELPQPVISSELIKPCKEIYTGCEILKSLVRQFLQQYYSIYDCGDRQCLLSAYHDEACFSLTVSLNPEDPDLNSLCKYFKHSRNIKMLTDPYLRRQLLKYTKSDIVDFLSVLPKTQHDPHSFLVDMWLQTEAMLCFSIYGVFKEVEGMSQGSVLAFTRTFVSTLVSNSSLCIVNDELFVRNAGPKETQSAFSIPMSSPSFSPEPALSPEQQEMVKAFSTQSGMKPEWSQKCLQDNEWNYTRAGQVFTMFQAEGKIPKEAFKHIP
ncbi:nuclear RNA export factor 2-like [Carlito syrichta]|uniref:Nuclear RNA export factor 2-like n=1 Tax=Carlito syrichta TaxID=1868482 RepID=A0A1U7UBX7_CARSF|nr:nuclear RNA export factor 2-like [Carlito syrichta]